nr:MAG TPA: hypothetical protein [Caudoviricetes sp.]
MILIGKGALQSLFLYRREKYKRLYERNDL